MHAAVDAFELRQPLLNPLDVWVWEVMAKHSMLQHALAPDRIMINRCEANPLPHDLPIVLRSVVL
jgi:hypothetical protein